MELNILLQARNIFMGHQNDKMSAMLAYKIMKFIKGSDNEEEFYRTKLNDIIQEYGEKNEDGKPAFDENGNVKIANGKIKECQEAIDVLEKTDVEKPAIEFRIEELAELRLSPKDIFVLDSFIIQ